MKKFLFIAIITVFVSCKKDIQSTGSNRFEISFIASDLDQTKSFTVFVTDDGKTFKPVKEVQPVPGIDILYKVQFEMPESVSDNEIQFYIQETKKDGENVNSQIVKLN